MSKNVNYETLMAQINELTKKAEAIRSGEVSSVIQDIRNKMNDFGLSIEDIQFVSNTNTTAEVAKEDKVVHRRRKPEAKYIDASTGNAWTGRGKLPVWLQEAMKQGKGKDEFLAKGIFKAAQEAQKQEAQESQEAQEAQPATNDNGKVVHRRRKPEIKYMDKDSGQAWSGRGKTPVWLKNALAQGKTMDQFSVG